MEDRLATGHRGSGQDQPWCTHGGNSLGSVWALGRGWVVSTPLIRLQIASGSYTSGPGARRETGQNGFLQLTRTGERVRKKKGRETEGAYSAPRQVVRKGMRDRQVGQTSEREIRSRRN